jgi:hypothetical protein
MKTAVASADDEGPKKKFGVGLPKKPSKGSYGLKPDKNDGEYFGRVIREKQKEKPKVAGAGAPPPDDKDKRGTKINKLNNKMKVVPLKERTIADKEREKAKSQQKFKGKGTNGKKTNGKK